MKYKFILDKMHCAGCALALEQNINSIDGVEAKISFVTKVLELDITTENPAETLTEVKIAITKFDHSVEILDYQENKTKQEDEKQELILKVLRLSIIFFLTLTGVFLRATWLKIVFFGLAYILVSYDVLINAFFNVKNGKIFDENFLMAMASIGAFVIGEYIEAVAVMFLFNIGEVLEDLAVSKSRKTIESVLKIKQPYANLYDGETDKQVPLSEVSVGDLLHIKPGERVPLDSKIIDGTSYLDMSALTGESIEKVVTVGDEILSGSINGSSVLLVEVQKTEKDSTVSKIIDLVQTASETKAKSEKFISKFSRVYTPTVIALAFVLMFVPPIFIGFSSFSTYAYRALCFLVVSCPCALVISVPLSYFAGIGACAKNGVMVKGANYLEALSKVDSVIFDKTGTLTEGKFEVSEIFTKGNHTKEEILEVVAYAENFSNHKIAKSITKAYKENSRGKEINPAWIDNYEEIAGKGVKARIFMQDVIVGNAKLLKENNINFIEVKKPGTTLYVAIGQEFVGYIVVSDTIKKDAIQAIASLKQLNIKDIAMSTGDEKSSAEAICAKLGITNCHSGLLPDEKLLIIKNRTQNGQVVAFVGDGINDAPSLANANVGISMGGFGSDIAVEASDVVIMTDEPSKVAKAIKKAKKTRKIVMQNIIGSICLKIAVLALTAFGFTGMWLAIFADVGVSLLAVLNSLRALLK